MKKILYLCFVCFFILMTLASCEGVKKRTQNDISSSYSNETAKTKEASLEESTTSNGRNHQESAVDDETVTDGLLEESTEEESASEEGTTEEASVTDDSSTAEGELSTEQGIGESTEEETAEGDNSSESEAVSGDSAESNETTAAGKTNDTAETTTAHDSTTTPETTTSSETSTTSESYPVVDRESELPNKAALTKYDFATYITPIWSGNYVYNETVMFREDETEVALLYSADKIYSVRSYDLKTKYVEGVDYVLKNGKIALLSGTSIPVTSLATYYPSTSSANTKKCKSAGHSYTMFGEYTTMTSRQVVVTYHHSGGWNSYIPEDQSAKFKNALEKLDAGTETTTILFYGDTITQGDNASGFVKISPNMPIWARQVTQALATKYGYTSSVSGDTYYNSTTGALKYVNTAKGGMDAAWGLANIQVNVINYSPDIVVLAFGMNGGATAKNHTAKMSQMIQTIKNALPNCEIVLVSTSIPNQETYNYTYEYQYESEYLTTIATAYPDVAIARMTTMHQNLLKKKRFYDMTSNNVNHPNDFLVRVYAQTVFRTIAGTMTK